MWVERNEGSKFWMGILNELKNRGVHDVLIAAVDGLTGFPETEVQLCMVHMVRSSLKYVPHKDRKAVAAGLKEIYLAPSADAAAAALERFAGNWDRKYPAISKSWRGKWGEAIPFLKFSPEIRRTKGSQAIYTTNAIESINYNLQRNLKTRLSFPSDEAAMKLVFMILRRISKKWTMPIRNWGEAMHQFSVIYGDRVPL
jgi:transposase-like protein